MNITFIRHTQVAIEPGTCYGWSDVDTAPTFQEEAQKVAADLRGDLFDKVYSSPLSRCQKLAQFCGFQPTLDNRLKELHFGNWELKRWDEISDPTLEEWYNDWIHIPAGRGENFLQQYQRVSSFLDDIIKSGKDCCIFTHRGVIACAMIYAGKCEMKDAFAEDIPYGSKLVLHF